MEHKRAGFSAFRRIVEISKGPINLCFLIVDPPYSNDLKKAIDCFLSNVFSWKKQQCKSKKWKRRVPEILDIGFITSWDLWIWDQDLQKYEMEIVGSISIEGNITSENWNVLKFS